MAASVDDRRRGLGERTGLSAASNHYGDALRPAPAAPALCFLDGCPTLFCLAFPRGSCWAGRERLGLTQGLITLWCFSFVSGS